MSQRCVKLDAIDPRHARTTMKWRVVVMIMLLLSATASQAEMGFEQRYERDYNIFTPMNKYQPDNPLNPVNKYDPDNPFNPVNRYDPDNPLNPINQYHPDNPLNPVNTYNSGVSFAPLDGKSR
jgi:hypothetical protein